MLETSPPVTTAPTTDRRASMKRTSAFVLILFGTVGGGVSHWFVVWLLAAAYGAADLGHYSVLLAGATPIFIFLGLGLKDAYVSLSDAPSWRCFFLWRSGGMTIGLLLLTVYCLAAAPYWGIFAGMAVMKVADGFLDISLGRLQRLSKFNTLGALSSAHAVVSITVISIAAWRRSTRLNSSHVAISYAVFCLKKKTKQI